MFCSALFLIPEFFSSPGQLQLGLTTEAVSAETVDGLRPKYNELGSGRDMAWYACAWGLQVNSFNWGGFVKDLYCYFFLVCFVLSNLCATPTPVMMVKHDRVQYREKDRKKVTLRVGGPLVQFLEKKIKHRCPELIPQGTAWGHLDMRLPGYRTGFRTRSEQQSPILNSEDVAYLDWPKCPLCTIWTASSEFGTYRLCEQRRFRRACASAQSRQNLRCSLIQAVSQEEPSDRKPDPQPLWMAGHAQLKLVMTECSKTQIRLTGLI